MTKEELRQRTKIFARDIVRFVNTIPANELTAIFIATGKSLRERLNKP